MTLCAFKLLFGFDCPGCGLTRSVLALLQGHFKGSVVLHPMGPIVFLGLTFIGVRILVWRWKGRKVDWPGAPHIWQYVGPFVVIGFIVPWMGKLLIH